MSLSLYPPIYHSILLHLYLHIHLVTAQSIHLAFAHYLSIPLSVHPFVRCLIHQCVSFNLSSSLSINFSLHPLLSFYPYVPLPIYIVTCACTPSIHRSISQSLHLDLTFHSFVPKSSNKSAQSSHISLFTSIHLHISIPLVMSFFISPSHALFLSTVMDY